MTDADRPTAQYVAVNPAYPGVRKANDVPPMYAVENFLSPEECALLIDSGRKGLKRSIVVDGQAGKSAAPSRTSESCYLLKEQTVWLADKINALIGKPQETHEPPQVARYVKDQYYLAHFDAFDVTTAPGRECCATGGQRVATVLIYLCDVSSGGGTFFPKVGVRFMPKRGTAVVFFPCTTDAKLDPLALHTAENAVDEKWVCQVWVRQFEFK